MPKIQTHTQVTTPSSVDLSDLRPMRIADVASYPLDTDLVLHDVRDGQSYALNHTGRAIWERCTGDAGIDEIAAGIAELFAIPLDQARVDTHDLLDALTDSGVITWSAIAGPTADAEPPR